MTDDGDGRGASRAQRIIAWPFILAAAIGVVGVAGLLTVDTILRYGANAPIRGATDIAWVALAGIFAVAVPAAAILGNRSGGPTHPPEIRHWWTALHTTALFLIEAIVLAVLSLLLLGDAFGRIDDAQKTYVLDIPLGPVQMATGFGMLVASVFVLIAGAIRLVRGQ